MAREASAGSFVTEGKGLVSSPGSDLPAEIRESTHRGYSQGWCVPEEVFLEAEEAITPFAFRPSPEESSQGVISAQGTPHHIYFPMGHQHLPYELAKVDFGSREHALDFVRCFGLLGYDYLLDPTGKGPSPDAYFSFNVGRDPLWFIWWHAKTVRATLELYHGVQLGDSEALNTRLRTVLNHEQSPDGTSQPMGKYISGKFIIEFSARREQDPEATALDAISQMINANVVGVHPVVRARGLGLSRGFTFYALVEAIWAHLLDQITRGGEMAICKECGSFFQRTDKRQDFCPPPAENVTQARQGGMKRAQSLCAIRNRTRRYRAKRP